MMRKYHLGLALVSVIFFNISEGRQITVPEAAGMAGSKIILNAVDPWQTQAPGEETPLEDEDADPLEPVNRVVFRLNYYLDRVFVEPVAEIYAFVTPTFVRTGVGNILRHLGTPVVLANDLMQTDWENAGISLARFVINTTLGGFGLMDVASEMGLKPHYNDFGLTLRRYGVWEGPYIVLPVFGPSNPADMVGFVVDTGVSPVAIVSRHHGRPEVPYCVTGAGMLNARANHGDWLRRLEHSSVDFYATIRSLYLQYRRNQRGNEGQAGASEDSPRPVPASELGYS
jgi:phospholipid-binding lipoprotein MlaA